MAMYDPAKPHATTRPTPPTNKAKAAVQRSVNALLDELAPEKTLTRGERIPVPIEQYRSPTGCVLQAADYAVSVSWFDESKGESLGELHIITWSGTVARRGATRYTKGAKMISETIVHPIDPPDDGYLWRGTDGTRYDLIGLVAKILSLLQEQASAGSVTGDELQDSVPDDRRPA
jgi:hypothetical protein